MNRCRIRDFTIKHFTITPLKTALWSLHESRDQRTDLLILNII